jgi:hypothetical protein
MQTISLPGSPFAVMVAMCAVLTQQQTSSSRATVSEKSNAEIGNHNAKSVMSC